MPRRRLFILIACVVSVAVVAVAQGPRLRRHTAIGVKPVRLLPANQQPPAENESTIEVHGDHRHVTSNAVPEHRVGRFPNRGNPNAIRAQRLRFSLPANPQVADEVTPLRNPRPYGPPGMPFGVAVNGVLFDPGTAEFWRGDRRAGWNYEALGGAVPLGIDANHAHVQPTGSYHYHGLPTGLLKKLGHSKEEHSPLVGWAADGFPIYARYGYRDPQDASSEIVDLRPSYRQKQGQRPAQPTGPGGAYDGTFTADYEYAEATGDLDECNGRQCVTPDFPDGTYAYFLTDEWPVIPRAFRGEAVRLR